MLRRNLCFFLLLFVFACLAGACSSYQPAKEFWKSTKTYYNEYLNTPAELNLDNKTGNLRDYQLYMGEAITDIVQQLQLLCRILDDSDRGINDEWVMQLFARVPWIAGVAVLDGEGNVMARQPEYSLKEFDAKPLLTEVPGQRRSALRAYVQNNPLGAEIYLGKPVYIDNELKNMVVVHFDMRPLLARSAHPDQLVVTTPDTLIWSGGVAAPSGVDWAKLLKGNVTGKVGDGQGEFFWVCSYFANLPLVYAVPVDGKVAVNEESLKVLKNAEAYAVPQYGFSTYMLPSERPQPVEEKKQEQTDSENASSQETAQRVTQEADQAGGGESPVQQLSGDEVDNNKLD